MAIAISVTNVGGRSFLVIEGIGAIPIDRIKCIDLNVPNGGCSNWVRIGVDRIEDDWFFTHENADAIREFLAKGAKPDDDNEIERLRNGTANDHVG